ncbi:MAG: hypothetical protein M3438_06430 [Pseudomonadota bacterium]|nr:hypothetical protein [Sphingomonas sp.]MDQ3478778.1 hypothetical protein [Pseudomonadota bacterium]
MRLIIDVEPVDLLSPRQVAVSFAAVDCTVTGRAFRTLAKLADASPEAVVRSLPSKSWNYEV